MNEKEHELTFKSLFLPFTTKKAIIFIIIIGFIVFGNMLFNGFVWDDQLQIINNQQIHSIANIPKLFTQSVYDQGPYYKPFMTSSFALMYSVFGQSAFFFHLIQLLLHIASTILVFLIFNRFFKKTISFICALIFLIHPLNTETVVYIASLQDVLFLFFGLLALYLIQKEFKKNSTAIVSFILLLASLFSKETGISFILIFLIYGVLFKLKKINSFLIGSLLTVCIYFIARFSLAGITLTNTKTELIPITTLPLFTRLLNIPEIIFYYIKTFIFPYTLVINQQWVVTHVDFSHFYVPLFIDVLFFIAVISLGIYLNKTKRSLRTYLFFCAWFLVGLALHLQIISLDMTVADRWFYFPMVGFLGIIGVGLELFNHRSKDLQKAGLVIAVIILISLSLRTMIRNTNWHDEITLNTHDLQIYESSDLEDNLGLAYFRLDKHNDALIHFKKSVNIFPTELNVSNIGFFYEYLGDLQRAENYYKKGLLLNKYPPKQHRDINTSLSRRLAFVYLLKNENATAKEFLKTKLMDFPENGYLWEYLAISEYSLQNQKEAFYDIKKAKQFMSGSEANNIYTSMINKKRIDLSTIR